MAGQHGYQTRHARLVALLVLVCLAAGLARRVTPFPRSSSSFSARPNWSTHGRELVQPNPSPNLNPDPPTPRLNPDRIHGRWEAVRASLGLPPLPHGPNPASSPPGRSDKRASRFDLGRKRRADEAVRQLPRFHFAHDTRPAQPGETETGAVAATPWHVTAERKGPSDRPN